MKVIEVCIMGNNFSSRS